MPSIVSFTDPPPTEIYTLSLHDALPIYRCRTPSPASPPSSSGRRSEEEGDRKSTRLNSSHRCISYAVFCLKKKNTSPCICTTIYLHPELTSSSHLLVTYYLPLYGPAIPT